MVSGHESFGLKDKIAFFWLGFFSRYLATKADVFGYIINFETSNGSRFFEEAFIYLVTFIPLLSALHNPLIKMGATEG